MTSAPYESPSAAVTNSWILCRHESVRSRNWQPKLWPSVPTERTTLLITVIGTRKEQVVVSQATLSEARGLCQFTLHV